MCTVHSIYTDVGVVPDIGQFRIHLTFNEYLHLMKINLFISFLCYIYFVTLSNFVKIKFAPNAACSACKQFLVEELSVLTSLATQDKLLTSKNTADY